jgi:TusA-related sulfurtransferase
MTSFVIDRTIDASGSACPGPLLALIGAIRQAEVGDVIEVISTDAGSLTDIPAWTAKARHHLVGMVNEVGSTRFMVQKAR